MDFSTMNVAQLEKHIEDAQNALRAKRVELLEEKRKKIEDFAKSLGTTVEELYGPKGAKPKPAPRKRQVLYVDDSGKTYRRAMKSWSPKEKQRYSQNVAGSGKATTS